MAMRVATILLSILMITTVAFFPASLAEPPNDGSDTTITTSESWNGAKDLDGNVVVASGGVLTINGQISVATGSKITVEDGGTINMLGELNAQDMTSGIFMEVYPNTVLSPYFENLISSGTLRINFAKEYFTSMDVNVSVGLTNESWTGTDYIDFNVDFNDEEINVSFSGFWQFPVWIESMQAIDSNGAIYTLNADEWTHNNGVLKVEDAVSYFTVDIKGTLDSQGGIFSGADIACHGTCNFENSSLSWSAPVNSYENSTISMKTSTINGSRSYEDIVVHDTGTITYDFETMTGTGGPTDSWIRLLSQRVITTNLKDAEATVHYEGLGYLGYDGDSILDSNGMIDLGQNSNSDTSKYLRMTEWVDSSGTLHQEDGMILITLRGGTTAWNGDYSITLDPAPVTSTHEASIPLPYVSVESVVPEDTSGTANKGLGVIVTVKNTGSVEVSTNIKCFEGTERADVTTLFTSLQPGESKELVTTWYANSSGAKSLNCKAVIPAFYNSLADDLGQSVGTESEQVSFKELEDTEDIPLILYSMIVIVIVIATLIFTKISAKKINPEEAEKDYTIEPEAEEESEAEPEESDDD